MLIQNQIWIVIPIDLALVGIPIGAKSIGITIQIGCGLDSEKISLCLHM